MTIEFWRNGLLVKSVRLPKNDALIFIKQQNNLLPIHNISGRWIIASNGLRN